MISRAQRMQEICHRHDMPLPAAALQFLFGHPQVPWMLLGPWSIADLKRNIELLDVDIRAAVWSDLRTAGGIHTGAPVA